MIPGVFPFGSRHCKEISTNSGQTVAIDPSSPPMQHKLHTGVDVFHGLGRNGEGQRMVNSEAFPKVVTGKITIHHGIFWVPYFWTNPN